MLGPSGPGEAAVAGASATASTTDVTRGPGGSGSAVGDDAARRLVRRRAAARCSASLRSRDRARTSSSRSWRVIAGRTGGELLVDGKPVSFQPPRRCDSGGRRSTSRRIAPTPCWLSGRCARTSPCPRSPAQRSWGPISRPGRAEPRSARDRTTADRHACAVGRFDACPAATSRRSTIARWIAEWRRDPALLRPDARHRHPHEAPDLSARA